MSARLYLERMMHRDSIAVRGESAASYALIQLIPHSGVAEAPSLVVALVVDVSGSMYEEDGTGRSRLRRVQEAVASALSLLRPNDHVALIAFGHEAAVMLPPTPLVERDRIAEIVRTLDRLEIDPGGTALDAGLRLAIGQVKPKVAPGVLGHILVLTDGETAGDQVCRELAEQLPSQHLQLSLIGIGTEWNEALLKDLALVSRGRWYYLDADQPDATERILAQEFGQLAATLFRDVTLEIRPVKDVRVKRCRQVVPVIRELQLEQSEGRLIRAAVGSLDRKQATKYILDLSLPARPDGTYVVAQVEATYTVAGQPGTTGPVPLQITYAAQAPSYINAEVARHIDDVQIFELNRNLQQAIATENPVEIRRLAETIEKKAEILGPHGRRKTMLARQVLDELGRVGHISRKTQLALDDCARLVEESPAPESASA